MENAAGELNPNPGPAPINADAAGVHGGAPPAPDLQTAGAGIYPPENFSELNCDDCMGVSLANGRPNRIHPSDEYLRGPKQWQKTNTSNEVDDWEDGWGGGGGGNTSTNKRFSDYKAEKVFDARCRLAAKVELADLPYKVYNKKVKAMAPVWFYKQKGSGHRQDGQEPAPTLTGGAIFRGGPNHTSRGGGYRAYQFGRAFPHFYTSPNPKTLRNGSRKLKVVFNEVREPKPTKKTVEKKRGHYPGGGTQRQPFQPRGARGVRLSFIPNIDLSWEDSD